MITLPLFALVLGSVVLLTLTVEAATYYAAPGGKEGNKGTQASPWPLAKANAAVRPGDTIILLKGNYTGTVVAPARSGKEGQPITYKAAKPGQAILTKAAAATGPYPEEEADAPTAILLTKRSYIVIEGLTVKNPGGRFIYAYGASHLTIQGCHFENTNYPAAWEACRFKNVGDSIIFRKNVVIKGNDSVAITGGRYHLIEGNTFEGASHTCLVLMGVSHSVVRDNTFTNPIQKLMEVFTGRQRDVGDIILKSEYLIIEDNIFGPAPPIKVNGTNSGSGSAGIQYAGNSSILRRNVFTQCGMGMDFSWYWCHTNEDPEAQYCEHNRFYHNTIYDCGWPARYGSGPGIWMSSGKTHFRDNIVANNLLYRNHAHPDAHFPKNTPYDVQFAFADSKDFRLFGNLLRGREADAVTIWNKRTGTGYRLADFEREFPRTAHGNLDAEPELINAERGDFRLRAGSHAIDAGVPLTAARASGKGKVIEVEDARYFTHGYGLIPADKLRIGAHHATAVKVDYQTNTITLDQRIAWHKGDPVTLDYQGNAPDIGAFEYKGK